MKFFIVGATGDIGSRVVAESLAKGHQVTALARNPAALRVGEENPALSKVKGNIFDPSSFIDKLKGHDVLMSYLGHRDIRRPDQLFEKAMPALIDACKQAGVKRLICITADHTASKRNPSHPAPWFYRAIIEPYILNKVYADMDVFEAFAGKSCIKDGVELTIVQPYYLRDWDTTECRAEALTDENPVGLRDCSYNTAKKALAVWLTNESWKAAWAAKRVVIDTPSGGCC